MPHIKKENTQLNGKNISTIAIFTALITVFSFIAHAVAWVGHPIIGGIMITFLYLTAFNLTGKIGTPTIIGILVGLINSFIWGLPINLLIQFVRGAVFDAVFFTTKHRSCCRKCVIAASMLSFYITMVVMFSLSAAIGLLPLTLWYVFFLMVGIPGALLAALGGLLALKYKRKLRWIS